MTDKQRDADLALIAEAKMQCEQYWNEHNIGDAEVHVALEFIYNRLCKVEPIVREALAAREDTARLRLELSQITEIAFDPYEDIPSDDDALLERIKELAARAPRNPKGGE